jgi:phenylalanyl-tRNA synthetase alpha chain
MRPWDFYLLFEEEIMTDLNELSQKLASIRQDIQTELKEIADSKGIYEYRKTIMDGKAGKIGSLMREMGKIPKDLKAEYGKRVNEIKNWAQDVFDRADEKLKEQEMERRYASEKIDITLPAKKFKKGNLHPNTQVRMQLADIFGSMGFQIYEGTEIETDYYNFTALNTPQDHPARDMQDTFYLGPEFLLRTQTSAGQVHVMENQKPPIKIISPGKVFRSDDDATHSPMFSQMEGLVVDKGITLCDLKGMLDVFVKKIFGEDTKTRLRPSYFPFTEPSVEVDVSCFQCHGKGCRLCKGTGWIEVLGAGVVNKKVLEGCGIDSDIYSGIAFGIGIERIAMLKYGINNIKLLFESDLRVLSQIDD